ncbi:MAG: hypothetical protein U9N86_10855 [Bacteroidota bacterium]|nr:hypothetical protein [Bacteroidota bacterium]
MLSQTFSMVDNGEIVESGIQRGSKYKGKKYGLEDPDNVYVGFGLYPEIGTQPVHNPETQTITGPEYTLDITNSQVNKAWVVTDKLKSVVNRELSVIGKEQKKQDIENDPLYRQLILTGDTDSFIDNCDDATRLRILKILVKKVI